MAQEEMYLVFKDTLCISAVCVGPKLCLWRTTGLNRFLNPTLMSSLFILFTEQCFQLWSSIIVMSLWIRELLWAFALCIAHFILFYCTFYSLFSRIFYLYLCLSSCVVLHILHCPLSGPDLTYISLLIISCIIEYVMNKKNLENEKLSKMEGWKK